MTARDVRQFVAFVTLGVELAWPFVYPRQSVPTETVNEVCRCESGGDCWCLIHGETCGCMEHGKGALRQPER